MLVLVSIFLWGVRVLLPLLKRVMLLVGSLTFLFLHIFALMLGWLVLLARLFVSPFVGVKMLKLVYLGFMLLLEVLLLMAVLPFLEKVCYVFVAGVWEAELLVARVPAGYIVPAKMMKLINTMLNSLSTFLFLPCYSFVSVSNLLRMFFKGIGLKGLLSLVGMHYLGIGVLSVVMVRVVPFLLFIPGKIGFLLICMVFINGFLFFLRC